MNSNKYTLDRFEGDYAVFLKYPNETESLQVHRSDLHEKVNQGDIVTILVKEGKYEIDSLVEETTNQKEKVLQLLDRLKNNRK